MAALDAYLLAGGQSQRMGRDKGLLELPNGQTLIEYIADQIREVCGDIFVVSNNEAYDALPFHRIEDQFTGRGPLAGIHAALQHTTAKQIILLSCDAPYLNAGLLQHLQEKAKHQLQVASTHEGRQHPFPGIYSSAFLAKAETHLKENQLRVMDFLATTNTHFENIVPEHPFHHSNLFQNLNTPDAFERFVRNSF